MDFIIMIKSFLILIFTLLKNYHSYVMMMVIIELMNFGIFIFIMMYMKFLCMFYILTIQVLESTIMMCLLLLLSTKCQNLSEWSVL